MSPSVVLSTYYKCILVIETKVAAAVAAVAAVADSLHVGLDGRVGEHEFDSTCRLVLAWRALRNIEELRDRGRVETTFS